MRAWQQAEKLSRLRQSVFQSVNGKICAAPYSCDDQSLGLVDTVYLGLQCVSS